MNGECVEYDKDASHQFDDGTSDMDGMGNLMVCGIDTDSTVGGNLMATFWQGGTT